MKAVIIYSSKHHGNTKKLLDNIALQNDVELIDVKNAQSVDLNNYDLIGFATGIYFSQYEKTVIEFANNKLPQHKNVFFIHTAGSPRENQNADIKALAENKNCNCLGTFYCKGFDTYGPFKLIGGINKKHPDQKDFLNANQFYKKILSQI